MVKEREGEGGMLYLKSASQKQKLLIAGYLKGGGGGSNMLKNYEFKHAIPWLFLSKNANLCITSSQFSQISGRAYPSYLLYKATFSR